MFIRNIFKLIAVIPCRDLPSFNCHSGVRVRPEGCVGAVPRLPEGVLLLYVDDVTPAGGDDVRRLIAALAPEDKW